MPKQCSSKFHKDLSGKGSNLLSPSKIFWLRKAIGKNKILLEFWERGTMKKIIAIAVIMLFVNTGCSVFMAMSGKKEPNLAVLNVGQDRGIVELNLGKPVQTYVKDDVIVDVYEVQFGNEPSGGRAIGHAAMDLLTFGGWEIIGTPVEGVQGKTETITVQYDKNNKLVSVNSVQGRAPKEDKKESEEAKAAPPKSTTNFAPKDK